MLAEFIFIVVPMVGWSPFLLLLFAVVFVITSLGLFQLILVNALICLAGIVPVVHLGRDFDLGIIWNEFGRNLDSVFNLDSSGSDGLRQKKGKERQKMEGAVSWNRESDFWL